MASKKKVSKKKVSKKSSSKKASVSKKKVSKKVSTECNECENKCAELSEVKILKILGTCSCTECDCLITNADFVEGKKTIVRCIRCGTECRLSQLRDKPKENKKFTKMTYLDRVVKPEEHNVPASYEPEIPDIYKNITTVDIEEWD